jgi:predicted nucleic acid-binding protein
MKAAGSAVPFVLDASTTVAWAFTDETHPHARAALERATGDRALVPHLWWYEVRNVLVVNERRGRGSPQRTEEFLGELGSLTIEVVDQSDGIAVIDLARSHNLTVYDAAYLALALGTGVPIATLDSELRSAAIAENVPIVGLDNPS